MYSWIKDVYYIDIPQVLGYEKKKNEINILSVNIGLVDKSTLIILIILFYFATYSLKYSSLKYLV